ncbi:MAG: MFS transporter [Anditalea sp.]
MGTQLYVLRQSTLLFFLICGIGISSWAPMVPYAKERLDLNDAGLGILLLLLGAGAIVMMPLTGILIHRYGSRKVILTASILLAVFLPLLLVMSNPISMGICLFIFGASVGAVDVAMNAHAVRVQHLYGRHIMSSFHGLFSVGGLVGSLGLGALIKAGLSPVGAAITISMLLLLVTLSQYKKLLPFKAEGKQEDGTGFFWPKKPVIYLGLMCFIAFLAEGAVLDWSAVFLQFNRGFDPELSGIGYAAFSVAMATMRLTGDRLVKRISPRKMVIYGSLISAAGFFIVVFTPGSGMALFGFVLVGLGSANIVPVFFSAAGNMEHTPAYIAIPAITTIGYAGQLAGPALLGFISYFFSLPIAIGFIGVLLLIVSFTYRHQEQT